ncbi:MAG: F0F1 ATP synthase subunit A [Aquidulcibacter sp.]|uniref:F0F1 ATP synthase subunit A n=1 Tax=Aquidulcibacter sp. TaxID=2052990 RepID=UPI0022BB2E1F|nr:F0F1 ATP synthase subunit A [Aquidulcibacter sp.]MCZ8282298.1 F0F1 ATP synthase subunit A [Aquidulcibacter sp.]
MKQETSGVASDPMHQFQIAPMIPMELAGYDVSFTNASLFLVLGAALPAAFMLASSAKAALVPGRMQTLGETAYSFVYNMLYSSAGSDGVKKFFPLVLSLFLFIFTVNMVGLFAYNFTPTSQIIVTAMMALLVFFTVIIVGFAKNGLGFLKLFVPSGIPWPLYIIVTPIEIISFFSRPLSHAVRLWANILAGHILVKVFAGFVPMMAETGAVGAVGAILPFVMTVALYALETLVAFLQAYVFTMLTCIYLNDALHAADH